MTQTRQQNQPVEIRTAQGKVYCPICTHSVEVSVKTDGRRAKVIAGQKCPRCSSSIDAGIVMHILQAA